MVDHTDVFLSLLPIAHVYERGNIVSFLFLFLLSLIIIVYALI